VTKSLCILTQNITLSHVPVLCTPPCIVGFKHCLKPESSQSPIYCLSEKEAKRVWNAKTIQLAMSDGHVLQGVLRTFGHDC